MKCCRRSSPENASKFLEEEKTRAHTEMGSSDRRSNASESIYSWLVNLIRAGRGDHRSVRLVLRQTGAYKF